MAYKNKRNEYNSNYTKEHYKRTLARMSIEDYEIVSKEVKLGGFNMRTFTLSAIELLLNGELENELKLREEESNGLRGSKSIFKK